MVGLEFFLALFWGLLWASALQFSRLGRWMAEKRTWITVVIGVGIDMVIALFVVAWDAWWRVALIIVASSVGVIFRSLWNELQEGKAAKKTPKPRLPNKVLWNLKDVEEEICPRVQGKLRGATNRARRHGDAELLEALAEVRLGVERVLRKMGDARHGEYRDL